MLISQHHTTTPSTTNLLKFSLPRGVSIHGKYATGEGKGERWMDKNMKNGPFFSSVVHFPTPSQMLTTQVAMRGSVVV